MFKHQLATLTALALLCGQAFAEKAEANPTEGKVSTFLAADKGSKLHTVPMIEQTEDKDVTFEDVLAASLDSGSRKTYYCPKGYGFCPQKKYRHKCCPLGGYCCNFGGCCKKGYYCVKIGKKKGCCPNGRVCHA